MALSDTGLVVRYYFDEATSGTSPTQVDDASGNAYHLDTINYGSGNMAWAGSAGTTSLESTSVTGTQRALRTIASSDALISAINGVTQLTVELVVTVDAVTGNNSRIFVVNDTAGGNARFGFVGASTAAMSTAWNGKACDGFGFSTGTSTVLHIVYDTTQGAEDDRVKVYTNGALTASIGSSSGIGASEALSISVGQQLIAFNREWSGSFDRSFDGKLHYAAIYTGAFDATRCDDHYDVLTLNDDTPASGSPTLSAAGANSITSTTAIPKATLTF